MVPVLKLSRRNRCYNYLLLQRISMLSKPMYYKLGSDLSENVVCFFSFVIIILIGDTCHILFSPTINTEPNEKNVPGQFSI